MKASPQWKTTPCYIYELGTNRQILVKDESACPNYTFKDRLGLEIAKRLYNSGAGPETLISSITMGNTAFSINWGIKHIYGNSPSPQILAVIPKYYRSRKLGPDTKGRILYGKDVINTLQNQGVCCHEIDFGQSIFNSFDILEIGKSIGLEFQNHIDVTEGIPEPCYGPLFEEVITQAEYLDFEFDTILVPVGAGILFETIVAEITKKEMSINVLGISVLEELSLADKLWAYFSPYFNDLKHYGEASSVYMSKHKIYCVTDNEIKKTIRKINGKIESEPSAAATFSLLERKEIIPYEARVLVINTGNGFLWALD